MLRAPISFVVAGFAVIVQLTIVDRIAFPGGTGPDVVLITVAALALANGPLTGALIGFSAGLALDQAIRMCEEGRVGPGLLWMARALELTPDGEEALEFAARANLSAWRGEFCPVLRSPGQGTAVLAVAFSPNGKTVLTGDLGNCLGSPGPARAQLWDAATWKPLLFQVTALASASAGTPASCRRRTASAAISGVSSAGFATTALPAASAAATWPVKMARGKFQGLMQTKTPRPCSSS